MNKIIRNAEYIPHQAIVFTKKEFLNDFSLQKVITAYDMRSQNIGEDGAIWEIEFHLTNLCNLKCSGCSYGTRHNKNSLTLEQVKAVIDRYSQYDLKSVFFSGGGDPLLWNHWDNFFNSVPKICSYGIATNMFNFQTIKKHWDSFDFYQIHITGYDEKSSKYSTGTNSFPLTDKNISYIFKHKSPSHNIALKVLLNEENYISLPQYLNYVMHFDADSIVLKFQQDFLNNHDLSSKSIIEKIRQVSYSHNILSKYDFLLDNLDDTFYSDFPCPETCLFANSGLYRLINADFEIFPCIASNFNKNNAIRNGTDFVDIYSKQMKNGNCPLKACRHYRFSQYLFNIKNKVTTENQRDVSLLL